MHSLSTSTVFPSESESMQAQSNSLVFIHYCMYCTVYLLSPSYRSMMTEPDLNGPLLFFSCFGCPVLLEYVTYIKSLQLYDLRILSLIHCMFIQFTPFILHTPVHIQNIHTRVNAMRVQGPLAHSRSIDPSSSVFELRSFIPQQLERIYSAILPGNSRSGLLRCCEGHAP